MAGDGKEGGQRASSGSMIGTSARGSGAEELTTSRAEAARKFHLSNRANSAFKWKQDKSVVGALEVPCEPQISLRAKYNEMQVLTFEKEFEECLKLWAELKMRHSFITAAESIPPVMKCCGLATDLDETVKSLVPQLNNGWAKKMNEKLKDKGYKVSCFDWSWSRAVGATETNILLIRFHSLTKTRS